MRAKLTNLNDCAVIYLSRATATCAGTTLYQFICFTPKKLLELEALRGGKSKAVVFITGVCGLLDKRHTYLHISLSSSNSGISILILLETCYLAKYHVAGTGCCYI